MLKHFSITLSVLLLIIIIAPGTKAEFKPIRSKDQSGSSSGQCYPPNPFLTLDDCISWSGGNTVKKSVAGENWSWSCGSLDSLEVDVFNHTKKTIKKVVFTETNTKQSWGQQVNMYPNTSERLSTILSHGICRNKKPKMGKLRLYYYETIPKVCVKRRSISKEEKRIWQEARETEYETCIAQKIIYDNCIISKSKGTLKSTLGNIRSSCREISQNPSFFETLRWGR